MRVIRVRNARSGAIFARRARLADSWWRRAVGLLGQTGLPPGSGLLLVPCTSVHTVGMRFALDVAFLDGRGRVVHTRSGLRPGRLAIGREMVRAILELPVGTLAATDTRYGDALIIEETTS